MPYWVFPAGQVRQLDLRLNPVREDQLFDTQMEESDKETEEYGIKLAECYVFTFV